MRRRSRGLTRLDSVGLEDLLPSRRARQLRLAAAWREVAGEALCRRAQAAVLARGIVDVHVEDERWSLALSDVLPQVVARLAALHPELGIRRYRVGVGAEPLRGPSRELPALAPLPVARVGRAAAGRDPQLGPPAEADLGLRVSSIAERYLRRARSRGRGGG